MKRYGLFGIGSFVSDEYFFELMGIVVEIKEVGECKFLLDRRPDISNLSGDGFDFDIINSQEVNIYDKPEELQESDTIYFHSQMEITFHKPTEEEDEVSRAVKQLILVNPQKEEVAAQEGEQVVPYIAPLDLKMELEEEGDEIVPLDAVVKIEPEE